MSKVRTTVTLDEDVLRAVKIQAARTGKRDSDVIEEALREHLMLGLFERIWARNSDLDDDQAMELALEAQRWAREELRKESGDRPAA
jgi:Ribbon-helix-helix protein, copG family